MVRSEKVSGSLKWLQANFNKNPVFKIDISVWIKSVDRPNNANLVMCCCFSPHWR